MKRKWLWVWAGVLFLLGTFPPFVCLHRPSATERFSVPAHGFPLGAPLRRPQPRHSLGVARAHGNLSHPTWNS